LTASLRPAFRRLLGATALLCALAPAAAEDPLLYVVEGDEITFTNQPAPGAQPIPGFETEPERGAPAPAVGSARLPPTVYDPYIEIVAAENGLSPELIKAVALVESGFDAKAVSHKGAQGLMQLMPETARDYGVTDAFDPLSNLRAGAKHLSGLLDQFDGDLTLALAAYNAGAGTVRRHNGVPDYAETVNYVRKVHEKLGRKPKGLPGAASVSASKPIRFKVLDDGSVLISN